MTESKNTCNTLKKELFIFFRLFYLQFFAEDT